jgi:hypothetical protein
MSCRKTATLPNGAYLDLMPDRLSIQVYITTTFNFFRPKITLCC